MKRLFDVSMSIVLMVFLAPLFLLIMVGVRVRLGTPVFFVQTRAGLRGRPFALWKFRTMLDARDARGEPLPDADRLTTFGRALRASSLDELPELWNVLKGDMSLVGPRPLLMEYLSLYSANQNRRHEVRPGITGWAQVNGRNALPWRDRLAMDVWYVDHATLVLDVRILYLTVVRVLQRSGIGEDGHPTMSRFRGEQ